MPRSIRIKLIMKIQYQKLSKKNLLKLAKSGDSHAQCWLAGYFDCNDNLAKQNIKKSKVMTCYWYSRAGENGSSMALDLIKSIRRKMSQSELNAVDCMLKGEL